MENPTSNPYFYGMVLSFSGTRKGFLVRYSQVYQYLTFMVAHVRKRRSFRKFGAWPRGEMRKSRGSEARRVPICPRCAKAGSGPHLKTVANAQGKKYSYWYFKHAPSSKAKTTWHYLGKLGERDFNAIVGVTG